MTLQEFYTRVGGNADDVVLRLGNEARITKVLGMLQRDSSMAALNAALQKGDLNTAFQAVHTLKGIALNLGLTHLAQATIALTETLRPQQPSDQIQPQLEQVQACHAQAIEAAMELLNTEGKEGGCQ